jgi:hypothetical protein
MSWNYLPLMTEHRSPAELRTLYLEQELSQEEYLDLIVENMRHTTGFKELLHCIYEDLYDEEAHVSRVSAFSDADLWAAIESLKLGCVKRKHEELPSYLDLLEELISKPGQGVMVRWGMARLVGYSLNKDAQKPAAPNSSKEEADSL